MMTLITFIVKLLIAFVVAAVGIAAFRKSAAVGCVCIWSGFGILWLAVFGFAHDSLGLTVSNGVLAAYGLFLSTLGTLHMQKRITVYLRMQRPVVYEI